MSCEQTTNYIEYRCEACTLFIALAAGRILAGSRSEAPGSTRPGSSMACRWKGAFWLKAAVKLNSADITATPEVWQEQPQPWWGEGPLGEEAAAGTYL